MLEDYDLVEKIGPADRSGLYEITPRGKAALVYRDQYDQTDDFDALIDGPQADAAPSDPAETFARGEQPEDED